MIKQVLRSLAVPTIFISDSPYPHMEQNTPLPGDGLEKLMTALIAWGWEGYEDSHPFPDDRSILLVYRPLLGHIHQTRISNRIPRNTSVAWEMTTFLFPSVHVISLLWTNFDNIKISILCKSIFLVQYIKFTQNPGFHLLSKFGIRYLDSWNWNPGIANINSDNHSNCSTCTDKEEARRLEEKSRL